jgi:vacuolar-type H+-ATPase subunit I/STV1
VESRYSTEYSEIEKRVDQLQRRISRRTATDTDHRELSQQLSKLEELVVREDKRRADSSTVAQMARLQAAFVKDLLSALKKARS